MKAFQKQRNFPESSMLYRIQGDLQINRSAESEAVSKLKLLKYLSEGLHLETMMKYAFRPRKSSLISTATEIFFKFNSC